VRENHAVAVPDQTLLAMERNYLAAERTMMAWIRTAISMIGFGFTLAKLFQSLAESHIFLKGPAGRTWTPQGVGMVLIALGTVALIAAVFDHSREVRRLQAAGLKTRFSLSAAVGTALAALGVAAFLSAMTTS
jgi:putative membrane protein